MSTLVTCLGESLNDFVPLNTAGQGEGAESTDFRLSPGGSIFNVTVGLARLGQHIAFAGKIAQDFFGRRLLSTLQAEGTAFDRSHRYLEIERG